MSEPDSATALEAAIDALQRGLERPRPRRDHGDARARTWSSRTTPPASRRAARRSATTSPRSSRPGPTSSSATRRLYVREDLVVQEWTATATHANEDAAGRPRRRADRQPGRMGRPRRDPLRGRARQAQGRLLRQRLDPAPGRASAARRGRCSRRSRRPASRTSWRSRPRSSRIASCSTKTTLVVDLEEVALAPADLFAESGMPEISPSWVPLIVPTQITVSPLGGDRLDLEVRRRGRLSRAAASPGARPSGHGRRALDRIAVDEVGREGLIV